MIIHELSYKVKDDSTNKIIAEEKDRIHLFELNESGINQSFNRLMKKVEENKLTRILY